MRLVDLPGYVVRELRENYDDPHWWKYRLAHRVVHPIHSVYPGYRNAVHVMEEDWDTLLVLDAGRADLFEAVADLDALDDYRHVESLGGSTPEWTRRNFVDREFGDTVYVTGNPQVSKYAGDAFHDIVEVWRGAFDEDHRTVLPEPLVDAAHGALERTPDKRLVVHFMQPHRPFVEHEELHFGGTAVPEDMVADDTAHGPAHDDGDAPNDPWLALEAGAVPYDEVWGAYADNLEFVLDEVLEFARSLEGKTVITSDHGNLLGERAWPVPIRLYGHPSGIRLPALVDVPWGVIESGERREIRDDGVRSASEAESDVIEERLRALGYAE